MLVAIWGYDVVVGHVLVYLQAAPDLNAHTILLKELIKQHQAPQETLGKLVFSLYFRLSFEFF